jgi:Putative methyltransferase
MVLVLCIYHTGTCILHHQPLFYSNTETMSLKTVNMTTRSTKRKRLPNNNNDRATTRTNTVAASTADSLITGTITITTSKATVNAKATLNANTRNNTVAAVTLSTSNTTGSDVAVSKHVNDINTETSSTIPTDTTKSKKRKKNPNPSLKQQQQHVTNTSRNTCTSSSISLQYHSISPSHQVSTTLTSTTTAAKWDFSKQLQDCIRRNQQQNQLQNYYDALFQLYLQSQYDTIRDEHHLCIVINACAKSAHTTITTTTTTTSTNTANKSASSGSNSTSSISKGTNTVLSMVEQLVQLHLNNQNNTKRTVSTLNIETLTALCKVYVHAGCIDRAYTLFHSHIHKPNIRTLNTLLRGCLWSAVAHGSGTIDACLPFIQNTKSNLSSPTTITKQLCGGVVTSELIWHEYLTKQQQQQRQHHNTHNSRKTSSKDSCKNNNSNIESNSTNHIESVAPPLSSYLDTSSYEASIQLLCQALLVQTAQDRITQYCTMYHINIKGVAKLHYSDPNLTNHTNNNNTNNGNSSKNKHSKKKIGPNTTDRATTTSNRKQPYDNTMDPATIFETLAVLYLALARAYAVRMVLLRSINEPHPSPTQTCNDKNDNNKNHQDPSKSRTNSTDGTLLWAAGQRCISAVKVSRTFYETQQLSDKNDKNAIHDDAILTNKSSKTGGGKRSWKTTSTSAASNSTRESSNLAYRMHRLSELERDALLLLKHSKSSQITNTTSSSVPTENQQTSHHPASSFDSTILGVASQLENKLLFFSGGTVTSIVPKQTQTKPTLTAKRTTSEDVLSIRQQLLVTSWYSFGLSQIFAILTQQRQQQQRKHTDPNLNDVTEKEPMVITTIDSDFIDYSQKRRAATKAAGSVMRDDGKINMGSVFSQTTMNARPLDIEIGSGFGTWIVEQAKQNDDRNYIAMELRTDRCYQIYTRALLHPTGPLSNLCVIGCDGNIVLRERIPHGTVSTFYAHHPEPPTQVIGDNAQFLNQLALGHNGRIAEPVHMLNSNTLLSMCDCLKKDGCIVIVSDNRSYTRFMAATFTKVMRMRSNALRTLLLNEIKKGAIHSFDDTILETVCLFDSFQSMVNIYSYTITNPNNNVDGCSYFDRLWRTGAGTHSETRTRFVIAVQRC